MVKKRENSDEHFCYFHLGKRKLNLFNLSLPPFVVDDGSTANTAIFSPLPVKNLPKLSRNVLLPAPGGPDKPIQQILMRILAWMGNNKRMA